MADPPDHCEAHATSPNITAPAQLDAVAMGAASASTTNMDLIATTTNAPSNSRATAAAVEDSFAAATDSTPVNSIMLATKSSVATHQPPTAILTSHHPNIASEEHVATSAESNSSRFAKLPGELRNRIYRAYFEDFREQKKRIFDIRKTTPTYLRLLHTDRMIRSEASSIFFKEYFCLDSFVAKRDDLEFVMEWRIKAICALVAIHDMHLPISITAQEVISVHQKLVRQLPLACDDCYRRSLVNRLVRFIANGTREVFVFRIGSEQQPGGLEDHYDHMVYVGRKEHVSPRYRIERVNPDAAVSPQQKIEQKRLHKRLLQVLDRIEEQGMRDAWYGRTPESQRLYQKLAEPKSAEFLRVEGPLAELDWNMFQ